MRTGVDTFVFAGLPALAKPGEAGVETLLFALRAWAGPQAWA